MPRSLLGRACTLAVGALLCSPVSPAHATEVVVPGCFGAATAVVCDVTVEIVSPVAVEIVESTVPVCAGSCTDVPLVTVDPGVTGPGEICVSYSDRSGTQQERVCEPLVPNVDGLLELVPTLQELLDLVPDLGPVLSRFELRDCRTSETGAVVYDTSTGRTYRACIVQHDG